MEVTARMHRASQRSGFSLVEMLVVVAIVSLLAAIAAPLTELAARRTKEEELRRALREIRDALDAYKRLVDAGHIARNVDDSGYPPDLAVLEAGVVEARIASGNKLYLLRRVPRDPFAPADVPAEKTWGLRSYQSPPDDPRPGKDVFDVHSMSNDVGLNGVEYRLW